MLTGTKQTALPPTGLVAAARAAVAAIERRLNVLIVEHSLAQRAATMAALSRSRLREIRALYTGPDSRNG